MAIKVQNKNDIGNPYHSEETGQFVSAEYASQAGYEDIKSYDKMSNKITSDYDISSIFEEDDEDDELTQFWKQLHGEKVQKKIEEMSNQELIEEIKECETFFKSNGIIIKSSDFFYGDLQLKCSNFRVLKKMMQQYPIDMYGCELIFSKKFKNYEKAAMTYPVYYTYNDFDDNIYMSDFRLNKMIKFNHLFFRNYNATKETFKYQTDIGYWEKASDEMITCVVMAHEYGHLIAGDIINQKGLINEVNDMYYSQRKNVKHSWFQTKELQMQQDIKDELLQMYKEKFNLTDKDFEKEISKYGKTNAKEFLAETFASMVCGKPTKIALVYKDYLKKYFKGE